LKSKLIAAVALLGSVPFAVRSQSDPLGKQMLQYGVEWRLIRAGLARLTWTPQPGGTHQADLHLESAGLVSKLHRVNDDYRAILNKGLCLESVLFKSEEGKRRRETKISFDGKGKVSYLERDLVKNNIALSKELDTPPCVHEYMGGLAKLRTLKLEPGQSATVPLTDGKKFAQVKVDAQEREQVKTPVGTFNAMRYEVHMFNGVILNRKARMHVWISDDARRLPVQIRVRIGVLIGTITLQLEKME
jgi:hypothetical protein